MIRPARRNDFEALWAIYRDAARNSDPHYSKAEGRAWVPCDTMETWWPERMASGRTWVGERDGRAVGFITLAGDHLDLFFVEPSVRGTGIGGLLYDTMITEAGESGIRSMTTYASLFLRPILEAKGWKVVDAQDVERNGETLRRFAMTKSLVAGDGNSVE